MSAHLKCELLVLICKIFMTPYVDKSSHLHTMTNIHAIIEHVGATSLAAPGNFKSVPVHKTTDIAILTSL